MGLSFLALSIQCCNKLANLNTQQFSMLNLQFSHLDSKGWEACVIFGA